MSAAEEAALVWLEAQEGQPARLIDGLIRRQAAQIQLLREGIPSDVTREEWEIIRELRRCAS